MAKRTREIVEKNEMYYENHVLGRGRRFHKRISYTLIIINALIWGWISQGFKRMRFLQQAGTMNLQDKEVMVWVDEQVRATNLDLWLIGITAMMLILFIGRVNRKIKGYELYKKRWIRVVPVCILAVLYLGMGIYFWKGQNVVTAFIAVFHGLQFVWLFKFLLPLEIRKSYEGIMPLLEAISNMIIEKL